MFGYNIAYIFNKKQFYAYIISIIAKFAIIFPAACHIILAVNSTAVPDGKSCKIKEKS
jgi:hypothetical protein